MSPAGTRGGPEEAPCYFNICQTNLNVVYKTFNHTVLSDMIREPSWRLQDLSGAERLFRHVTTAAYANICKVNWYDWQDNYKSHTCADFIQIAFRQNTVQMDFIQIISMTWYEEVIECEGTIYLHLALRCLKAGLIKTVSILIVLHHETHQTHNCVLSSPMSHPSKISLFSRPHHAGIKD